ncbi:MAG: matrixin family metalloprotease [Vampirovibrionia bacterium]
MHLLIILSFLSISLFTVNPVKAAGLLGVCLDQNLVPENCSSNKLFFPTYRINNGSATVKYRIDKGVLGDLNNATLQNSVNQILSTWENVSSLDFSLDGDGLISSDVDETNYNSILFSDGPLGYSPIIFDDSGKILIDVLGAGSENDILGFATARFFSVQNNQITGIIESQSLINGYLYKLSNRPDVADLNTLLNEFKSTILHEFAHMVGLDHSQGGQIDEYEKFANGESSPDLDLNTFPIMFPISANPKLNLQKDDISSINIAYPKNQIVNNSGTITGSLINGNQAVIGANVIAYNINNPLQQIVTSASDVDGLGQGNFVLPYLSPGSYIIKVEPIAAGFTSGSSIGLHNPPNNPSSIPRSFYNGSKDVLQNLDLDSALAQAFKIDVVAGENINNIQINLGENEPANFELSGKAINQVIFLTKDKAQSINLRIDKIGSGSRYINLSTDYGNLISFSENPVRIRSNETTKIIKVKYSSLNKFVRILGDELSGTFSIPIQAEDIVSGDLVANKILRVF